MIFDLPNKNIAEITLLGTGGGYGESLVIHLGNHEWCIIDSCIDPTTKESLPLTYLNKIGVDVVNNVKMIVCTHWHDDHIQGISKLLEVAKAAEFVMAMPSDKSKFLRMVKLDYTKSNEKVSNSSTVEFNQCLEIIEKRKSIKKRAVADRNLYFSSISESVKSEIFSLSPSDSVLESYDLEISQLIENYGESRLKIISLKPNDKSVVLLLKLGSHNVLLGADLEVGHNNKEGWLYILDSSTIIKNSGKSSLFKIPHHGSENGYHIRIWDELLNSMPIAKLTPWNKNNGLPQLEMLQRYSAHCSELYMTSPFSDTTTSKKRDKKTEKDIKQLGLKLSEIKFSLGIVRNRILLDDKNANWNTEIHDKAIKVN